MTKKEVIEIVKATAPVLQNHGESITKVFYKRLFENHPDLKDIFNMVHQKKGSQQKVLANTIFQYAVHIDKLEMLTRTVETIAQKHSSLSIPKEAYPIVGENLMEAIKDILGEAATPDIVEAWTIAYGDLAAIFIHKEEKIYGDNESSSNGFRGTKEFVITKKVNESDVITSFYLKRKDGKPTPHFIGGQYIAVTIEIPNTSHKHTRNYSLSNSKNDGFYRISIKKEAGNPDGIVSNYFHSNLKVGDTVVAGMPAGDFTLNRKGEKPIVLISGGVGITPLLSICKDAINSKRDVTFIQCALNSNTVAFSEEIEEMLDNPSKLKKIFSLPLDTDKIGDEYDYKGFLSLDMLLDQGLDKESEFYFCGPTPFMANTLRILNTWGVKNQNIYYEFFGPKENLV